MDAPISPPATPGIYEIPDEHVIAFLHEQGAPEVAFWRCPCQERTCRNGVHYGARADRSAVLLTMNVRIDAPQAWLLVGLESTDANPAIAAEGIARSDPRAGTMFSLWLMQGLAEVLAAQVKALTAPVN